MPHDDTIYMAPLHLAGRLIMENGGETYRVEETITRMGHSFGFDEVVSDAPEQDTNGIHHKLVGFLNCRTKNTRVLGAVITLPI